MKETWLLSTRYERDRKERFSTKLNKIKFEAAKLFRVYSAAISPFNYYYYNQFRVRYKKHYLIINAHLF